MHRAPCSAAKKAASVRDEIDQPTCRPYSDFIQSIVLKPHYNSLESTWIISSHSCVSAV